MLANISHLLDRLPVLPVLVDLSLLLVPRIVPNVKLGTTNPPKTPALPVARALTLLQALQNVLTAQPAPQVMLPLEDAPNALQDNMPLTPPHAHHVCLESIRARVLQLARLPLLATTLGTVHPLTRHVLLVSTLMLVLGPVLGARKANTLPLRLVLLVLNVMPGLISPLPTVKEEARHVLPALLDHIVDVEPLHASLVLLEANALQDQANLPNVLRENSVLQV